MSDLEILLTAMSPYEDSDLIGVVADCLEEMKHPGALAVRELKVAVPAWPADRQPGVVASGTDWAIRFRSGRAATRRGRSVWLDDGRFTLLANWRGVLAKPNVNVYPQPTNAAFNFAMIYAWSRHALVQAIARSKAA